MCLEIQKSYDLDICNIKQNKLGIGNGTLNGRITLKCKYWLWIIYYNYKGMKGERAMTYL